MNRRQAISMLAILAGSALPMEKIEAALEVKDTYSMDDIEITWKELSRSADGKVVRGTMTVHLPDSPQVRKLAQELDEIQREHLK
ncbi:MAG: hypothetical protein ACE5FB_02340 [Candidatus Binatia bacterium]